MRLFLYYAAHSLLNTLKKLLKTWVAVILVITLAGSIVGGIIGMVAGKLIDKAEETHIEEEEEEHHGLAEFMEKYGLQPENVVDIAISAVFLFIFATNVINSKNSGKIFQPGDVTMLFASPLKPQSVMLFRLTCSLGSSLFVSLFALFQIPNLVYNAGFSVWGAFSIIVVYTLILVISTLIQVVFYTITSRMKNGIANINKFVIGLYGAIALGFVAYLSINKVGIVQGMFGYFANPATHWIPVWGWLRGISYYAVTGDTAMSLIYLGLFVVACIFTIFFIWKVKADFYEDAMFAAERKAEAIENAQRASKGATVTREKERKGSLEREGFHYGSGANVFFYKAVYNRFRFAKFKIFSTTMIVYMIAAAIAAFLTTKYYEGPEPYFIPAVVLGVMAFYRTIGDPIREDTSREFFILIPEKGYAKIVYSLLGCMAVNAIDLIVPMIIAAVILGSNPLSVLLWLLFILSISFFATTVGTFISLSIPVQSAEQLKTILQMMFLYFGLTPSAIVVLAGAYLHQMLIAIAIGTVINFATGFLFSLLLPPFLGRK